MDTFQEHTIPWHLIVAALQQDLTPEEETELNSWLALHPDNQQTFNSLKNNWKEKMDDYPVYLNADSTAAWAILKGKLEKKTPDKETAIIIEKPFLSVHRMKRWSIAATILVLIVGMYWFWNGRDQALIYKTAINEQKTIPLPDGSTIALKPGTTLKIPSGYNEGIREVILIHGAAFFEVIHKEHMPFIVNMGSTTVKDLGTSFSIMKEDDSISVSVTSGEVEFLTKSNMETKVLSAGMTLQYNTGTNKSQPAIIRIDTLSAGKTPLLNFDDVALSEVMSRLQEAYNRKIVLMDSAVSKKRFKGYLEGQSFEEALDILCKSLDIKYFTNNGVYYLQKD